MPKKTQGKVGQLFKQAKENITYYLKTGESKGFSGHTLMWEVSERLHRHEVDIREFVKEHLTQEFCLQLDNYVYQHLLEFQDAYVTSPDESYPSKKYPDLIFMSTSNNIDSKLVESKQVYNVDIQKMLQEKNTTTDFIQTQTRLG